MRGGTVVRHDATNTKDRGLNQAVNCVHCSQTQAPAENWNPYFGEPMSNVTVPLGREAVFTCVVRNLGQFKVGWLKAEDQTLLSVHNFVVTHNPRISVSQDTDKGIWRLHIRQLKNSDRGCYMCQINSATMMKQIGCLDLQVPPDIVDAESSNDVTASEGDNVTLSCRATGRPEPRILWKREDSSTITVFSPQVGFSTVDSWNGEVLQIVDVDYKQMGAFLCIATNDIPPAVSKRIVLIVNFAPVTQSPPESSMGAALGSTISLSCVFHGYPNENTTWLREIGGIEEYG
ncbi:lachesin, partial [Halyomorpha halys]|uniref:lachesin n=1 Tax=Halyomorpha halys TaxID=286706 RepID=UPI0006D4F28C